MSRCPSSSPTTNASLSYRVGGLRPRMLMNGRRVTDRKCCRRFRSPMRALVALMPSRSTKRLRTDGPPRCRLRWSCRAGPLHQAVPMENRDHRNVRRSSAWRGATVGRTTSWAGVHPTRLGRASQIAELARRRNSSERFSGPRYVARRLVGCHATVADGRPAPAPPPSHAYGRRLSQRRVFRPDQVRRPLTRCGDGRRSPTLGSSGGDPGEPGRVPASGAAA